MRTLALRGSRITPAPYEKAQASDEEICKRAAHPSSKLNQKKCRVACAYLCESLLERLIRQSQATQRFQGYQACIPTNAAGKSQQVSYYSSIGMLEPRATPNQECIRTYVPISNACHSLLGVAERLQHTYVQAHQSPFYAHQGCTIDHIPRLSTMVAP